MRNTQCIQNVSLGYLCYSHEVEKTERLRFCKVKISIRKRPHVTRICVLHKVVDFLFFLGFSQDINFYPFGRNWGWEGLPWNNYIIPTRKTNLNLKQICFSGLAQFDSVCVRLPKSHRLSWLLLSFVYHSLLSPDKRSNCNKNIINDFA